MGAGILPTTIIKGKLYFLFGKENKYADTPGFSDFGGGTEKGESYIDTAVREGGEELTGFLGSDQDLKKMIKSRGTFNIDYQNNGHHQVYRMHILPFPHDTALPHYYNNNQKFLQKRLDPEVIKKSKIFEKSEICWICVDELLKRRSEFRSYFQNIVDLILANKDIIKRFIQKKMPNNSQKKMNRKSIMGLDFSKYDDSDEEIPELVENEEVEVEENYIAPKRVRKTNVNARKSKRQTKTNKKTRKQVRFN
jgi:transcription termination factor NusB